MREESLYSSTVLSVLLIQSKLGVVVLGDLDGLQRIGGRLWTADGDPAVPRLPGRVSSKQNHKNSLRTETNRKRSVSVVFRFVWRNPQKII